jgi:hypothetical protein
MCFMTLLKKKYSNSSTFEETHKINEKVFPVIFFYYSWRFFLVSATDLMRENLGKICYSDFSYEQLLKISFLFLGCLII